jgi:hypothetical protein
MKISATQLALSLLACCAVLGGCGYVATHTGPTKHATAERTAAALAADEVFWKVFHSGDYDHIPMALDQLTAAYLQNPNDPITAAHVGWLHIWRISERARMVSAPPTITDDMMLAQHYFQEAVTLNPDEARYKGFLAAATLGVSSLNNDPRLTRRGYYELIDAINAWPEFNLFTAGYVMSQQPANSKRFKEGLEWQWRNADVCAGATLDRHHPDFAPYMSLATTQGKKRACWNTSIAPHNLEGFFLNMGDMLVASGDWRTAQVLYANAKLPPSYASWKYRDVLEQRIVNAQSNVTAFRTSPNGPGPHMMVAESYSCMACHER